MSTGDDLSMEGMASEGDAADGSRLGSEDSVVRFHVTWMVLGSQFPHRIVNLLLTISLLYNHSTILRGS